MALATNSAQQTTTMKGAKPSFEAMHREDWLTDWSREGPRLDMATAAQGQALERQTTVLGQHSCSCLRCG